MDYGIKLPPKKQWKTEYGVWRATCLLYPSTSMFVKVCPNIGLCIWWQISDNNIHLSVPVVQLSSSD